MKSSARAGSGRSLIGEKYGKRLESAKRLLERHGAIVIFLFAVAPLPDDLLFIPLGLLRYDPRKALLACFLGRWILCTSVAYAGKFSYQFVVQLFTETGVAGVFIGIGVLAILIVAILKVDWTRFLDQEKKTIERVEKKLDIREASYRCRVQPLDKLYC